MTINNWKVQYWVLLHLHSVSVHIHKVQASYGGPGGYGVSAAGADKYGSVTDGAGGNGASKTVQSNPSPSDG